MDLDSAVAYRMLEDTIEFVLQILTTGNLGVEPLCTVPDQRRLAHREDIVTNGNNHQDVLKNVTEGKPLRSLRAEILTGHTQSTAQLGHLFGRNIKVLSVRTGSHLIVEL
uniref:Glutamyl-tRNA(Gln) amidotransferase subunit C-1, mitochondrial n=1 Tax=Culex pipiens TaxID=7175 RepID=A0A8D8JJ93_CULPI